MLSLTPNLVLFYDIIPISVSNFRHNGEEEFGDLLNVQLESSQDIAHAHSISVFSPAVVVRSHGDGCVAEASLLGEHDLTQSQKL